MDRESSDNATPSKQSNWNNKESRNNEMIPGKKNSIDTDSCNYFTTKYKQEMRSLLNKTHTHTRTHAISGQTYKTI